MPNDNLSCFVFGMVFIIEYKGKGIRKNRGGFIEADTMFSEILRGFLSVPLESQSHITLPHDIVLFSRR